MSGSNGHANVLQSSFWPPLLVFAGTVACLRVLLLFWSSPHWLVIPCLLALGAGIGCRWTNLALPLIGLNRHHLLESLKLVAIASMVSFPLASLALWTTQRVGVVIPLPGARPPENRWGWVVYQFAYIAVAEEFFFRGYLQRAMERSLDKSLWEKAGLISLGLSAIAFGLSHWILTGLAISLLTAIPGFVLAWLYRRTACLMAPILYHGLANCYYATLLI